MAGAVSTNAVLFTLAILLILAWKVAGYYGLDRFLLPLMGTQWTWGGEKQRSPSTQQPVASARLAAYPEAISSQARTWGWATVQSHRCVVGYL